MSQNINIQDLMFKKYIMAVTIKVFGGRCRVEVFWGIPGVRGEKISPQPSRNFRNTNFMIMKNILNNWILNFQTCYL